MKTNRSLLLGAALVAAVVLPGCSKSGKVTQDAKDLAGDIKTTASDSWDSIKDYAYEKREAFAAGLDRMADKYDANVQAMNGTLSADAAKARDSAKQEYSEARASLKAATLKLSSSSAELWSATKTEASEAWQRVETAYQKLKSGPSS